MECPTMAYLRHSQSSFPPSDRYIDRKATKVMLSDCLITNQQNQNLYTKKLTQSCLGTCKPPNQSKHSTTLNLMTNGLMTRQKYGSLSMRKVPCSSFKKIDTPGLLDDFYLNLIDWSSEDTLAVALAAKLYILSGSQSKSQLIYQAKPSKYLCSVGFNLSPMLAIGDSSGKLKTIDLTKHKIFHSLKLHYGRIGSLSWHGNNVMATGSRDGMITISDIRSKDTILFHCSHSKQICGIKWDPSGRYLASGGSDNKVTVFDFHKSKQLVKFHEPQAAVKALDWCPCNDGLLAAGGGTNDRTIRFFDTKTLIQQYFIEAGTQICNLAFSRVSHEMVTTHGYSLNQINLWESSQQWRTQDTVSLTGTMQGHACRVLYLAYSPSKDIIVTGAGDETLRFWNIFNRGSLQTSLLSADIDLR